MKRSLLLCLLCIISFSGIFAQKGKPEKAQRKEFLDIAVPACVSELEKSEGSAGLGGVVNAKGYCTCMMENMIEKYTVKELEQLFVNKDESEMLVAFFEDEANYSKTMECMRDNVKNKNAMKQYVLSNSFGVDACTEGINESGLQDQISSEGYCKCMFDRLAADYSLEEILNEATYETEKFKVMAMECVLANTKD